MKKNHYLKQCAVFYVLSAAILFVFGLYFFNQLDVEVPLWLLIGMPAITAVISTLTMIAIDFVFILIMSILSGASVSLIYKYMNASGQGTASLQSYMTRHGRNKFRKLIEDGEDK